MVVGLTVASPTFALIARHARITVIMADTTAALMEATALVFTTAANCIAFDHLAQSKNPTEVHLRWGSLF